MTWIAWRLLIRHHLAYFLMVLTGIGFLIFCLRLADFSQRGAHSDAPFSAVLEMAALHTPDLSLRLLPIIILVSVLWSYARLARQNFLVIVRSSGFTPLHTLMPAVVVSILLGFISVGFLNPLSAQMIQRLERLEADYLRGASSLLSVAPGGIWLRQEDSGGQSVIHAHDANRAGTKFNRVEIFGFNANGEFVGQISAANAELKDGFWVFKNARVRDIAEGGPGGLPPQEYKETHAIPTHLTAEGILDSVSPPEAISAWKLPGFIRTLRSSGFSASRHRTHLHALLALPLVMVVMALIAATAGMRHPFLQGRLVRVSASMLAGLSFFFVLYVMQTLAGSDRIPVEIAIWGTVSAGLLAAVGSFLNWEPG